MIAPTLFTAPALPFTIAILLMLAILALEAIGMLAGSSVFGALDEALPDVDADFDADVDGAFDGGLGEQALAWLSFGKVPILVLIVLFLTGFGLSGLVMQALNGAYLGGLVPTVLVAAAAFLFGTAAMRVFGAALGRIVPKEETAAISRSRFVGMAGAVTGGVARRGLAAQVRLTDAHGTTHYVLAEPDRDDETFTTGDRVLVVSLDGHQGRIIADPHAGLD